MFPHTLYSIQNSNLHNIKSNGDTPTSLSHPPIAALSLFVCSISAFIYSSQTADLVFITWPWLSCIYNKREINQNSWWLALRMMK